MEDHCAQDEMAILLYKFILKCEEKIKIVI